MANRKKEDELTTSAAIGDKPVLPAVESRPVELLNGEIDIEYKCLGCGYWEIDVTLEGLCMACWYNEQEPE